MSRGLEGRRLGRYLLRYRVAQGGMAAVYLAQLGGAHKFAKWVAVKIIHPHLAEDRRFVEMFLDEAHIASGIHHPNACAVLDFGEEGGVPYLVMEYLHGETFSSVMRNAWKAEGLPPWLAARVTTDAARGLHAAHEMRRSDGDPLGLVHRDVSPQNIMVLFDGASKIMDFGIARAEGRITKTRAGEVKGKYGYMSPEQLRGDAIDRRTDVWALGVVLWEATVGRRLFRGESDGETISRVMNEPIQPPSALRREYPSDLEAVIMRALDRNPETRTASAAELADGLDTYLYSTGRVVGTAQVGTWMQSHLTERKVKRETMLFSPGPVEPGDIAEVDLHSHSTLGSRVGGEELDVAATSRVTERASSRKRWPAIVLAAVALGVVAGVGGWWLGARGERSDDAVAAVQTEAATQTEPRETDQPESAERLPAAPVEPTDPAPAPAPEADVEPEEPVQAAVEAPREPQRTERDRRPRARRQRTGPPREATADAPAATPAPTGTGRLNLLAIPSAEVFLGSRALGTTPLLGLELPAGQHTLRLRSGDAERTVRVTIRAGEQTRTSVTLR